MLGLIETAKGFAVTLQNFFAPPETIRYPEEKPRITDRWRGIHGLFFNEEVTEELCVSCALCARVCPALAIEMEGREKPDGRKELVRFDVDLGVKALAVKEAKEEAGVKVTEDRIVVLNQGVPMALSAGILAERAYLCYVEVTEDDFEQEERSFGTDAGEHVRRVWIPTEELEGYVCEDIRVWAFNQWFLRMQAEGVFAEFARP